MGLFAGVASLLHLNIDTAKKAQIREEIDLPAAVQAHIQWKIRLQNFLDGTSGEQLDPVVICRDDQCELGRWIHGAGMNHFHELAPFHQLRAEHAQFHQVAANVVKNVQANERAAAVALMGSEYPRISHQVVRSLTGLNKALNE